MVTGNSVLAPRLLLVTDASAAITGGLRGTAITTRNEISRGSREEDDPGIEQEESRAAECSHARASPMTVPLLPQGIAGAD